MKKLLCAIAMCVALVSGAFAQEAETSSKKAVLIITISKSKQQFL